MLEMDYLLLFICVESFELWPSYKVEKLHNARGRAFVCEITSADFHIFLSADEEKQIDVLVFLLQIQIRLKENIKSKYSHPVSSTVKGLTLGHCYHLNLDQSKKFGEPGLQSIFWLFTNLNPCCPCNISAILLHKK